MTDDAEILRQLPGMLTEIAEITDVATALKFAQAFGGQRIYIAERPPAEGHLVRVMGQTAASAIARHFAQARGAFYVVPRFANSRTLRVLQSGASANEIARAEGCTRRRVEQIRQRKEKDPRQASLFQQD